MASNANALAYARRYVRRSGKNTRMALPDTLESANPGYNNLVKSARFNSQDLYRSATSTKRSFKNTLDSSYSKGIKNSLLAEIKNPGWYYKKRNIENNNIVVSDDDFGLEESNSSSTIASIEQQSSSIVTRAIENMGINVALSVSEATVRSADYIVQSNRLHAEAINNSINGGFDRVMKGFKSLNTNLEVISGIVKPLNTHIQTTNYFQTRTLEFQEQAIALLQAIVANNNSDFSAGREILKNNKFKLNKILNPRELYRNKPKITQGYDKAKGMLYEKLLGAIPDPDLQETLQMILPMISPYIYGNSRLNNAIGGIGGRALHKARNTKFEGHGIFTSLFNYLKGEIVPEKNWNGKKDINTGKFNHGKVDWDGDSRKALIDVIPTQLGQILAALTGEEFKKYDYTTGRFLTFGQAQKIRNNNYRQAALTAGGNFRNSMNSAIVNSSADKKTRDQMLRDTDSFLIAAFGQDTDAFMAKILTEDPSRISDKEAQMMGFSSKRSFINWRKMYDARRRQNDSATNYKNLHGNIVLGQEAFGMDMRARTASGDPLYSFGLDKATGTKNSVGSRKNWASYKTGQSILEQMDEYNHNLFFYLQGIYRNTGYLMKNFELLIPAKGHATKSGTRRTKAFRITKGPKQEEAVEQPIDVEEESNENIKDITDEQAQEAAEMGGMFSEEITPETFKMYMDRGISKVLNKLTAIVRPNKSRTASQTHADLSQDIAPETEGGGASGVFSRTFNQVSGVYNKAVRGKRKVQEQLDKEETKQFIDAISERVFGDPNKVNDFIHQQLPDMAKGGALGTVAGAFLGSPIAGLMVGSAIGYVKNSEKAKKWLFGDIDENGNRKDNGIVPKKVQDFFKKYLPDVGKGAGIGLVAGTFMGSPILGAVLGSTVGYVKNSEKAKEFLFGKADENGGYSEGLIPKKVQETIKSALPKMAAGAGIGMLFGPFGMAGNIILGSAIGLASETDGFKKWMFGDKNKGEGGFSEKIKKELFDPITESFFNLTNIAKQQFINVGSHIRKSISDFLLKKVGGRVKNGIAKSKILGAVTGAGKKVASAAFGAVTAPGKIVQGRLRRAGLKGNYTLKDARGNDLTLEQRNALRDELGMGSNAIDTALLQNIGSIEDIDQFNEILQRAQNPDAEVRQRMLKQQIDMGRSFRGIRDKYSVTDDTKTRKSVSKVLDTVLKDAKRKTLAEKVSKAGNPEKYLNSISGNESLSPDERKTVLQQIEQYSGEQDTRANLINEAQGKLRERLASAGMSEKEINKLLKSGSSLGYMQEQLSIEKKNLQGGQTTIDLKKDPETVEEATRKTIPGLLRSIFDDVKTIANNITGKSPQQEAVTEETQESAGETTGNRLSDAANKETEKANKPITAPGQPKDGETRINSETGYKEIWSASERKWNVDTSDTDTNKKVEENEQRKSSIMNIPIIGSTLTGLSGVVTKISEGLFGTKEKKEGIFSKLFDKLTGEDGILGGIMKFFTGATGGKGIVGSLLSKFNLSAVLPAIGAGLGLAAVVKAMNGDFDAAAEKFGDASILKGNDSKSALSDQRSTYVTASDGKQYTVKLDENGKPIRNEAGEFETIQGGFVTGNLGYSGSDNRLSSQLKENLATGFAIGNGSVLSHATSKALSAGSKLFGGKAINIDLSAKGMATGLKNVATSLASGSITDSILNACTKIAEIIPKVPVLNKLITDPDDLMLNIADDLASTAMNAGSKLAKFADAIGTAVAVIKIGVLIATAVNAWGNAESILGITEKATTGQRIIATLLATLNAAIPVIGNLIPNKTLVNIFVKVCERLGIAEKFPGMKELIGQREKAEEDVSAYNELTGENLSIQEYNERGIERNENGEFVQGKARAGIFTRGKNALKAGWNNIKEQGFGKWASNKLARTGNQIATAVGNTRVGQAAQAVYADIRDTGEKALEYVSEQVNQVRTNITSEIDELKEKGALGYANDKVEEIRENVTGAVNTVTDAISDTVSNVREGISNEISELREEGAIGYIGNKFDQAGQAISGGWNKFTNFLGFGGGGASGISNTVKNIASAAFPAYGIYRGAKHLADKFTSPQFISDSAESAKENIEFMSEKVTDVFSTFQDKINKFTSGMKDKLQGTIEKIRQMQTASENGEVSNVFNTKIDTGRGDKKKSAIDTVTNLVFTIAKVYFTIKAFFNKLVNPIKGLAKKAKDFTDDKLGFIKNIIFGEDKEDEELSASGSGMISQLDSSYSGLSVGGRSMADNGCGPSTALMAINDLGGHSSMRDAISVANRYQTTGGTDAAYFGEMFARNGAHADYYRDKGSIASSIASGHPTVLMGRDSSNRSKLNSPFGPKNHYVVANGFDRAGNVIVKDPESKGVRKYSSNILNSVKLGIGASGGWFRRGRYGAGAAAIGTDGSGGVGGKSSGAINYDNSDQRKVIWDYLHSLGLSDFATAGAMGCWEAESKNTPRRVEGDYLSRFPGYDNVFSSPQALTNYATGVLFPAYAASNLSINQDIYNGGDGNIYPGIGLAQWTGHRAKNLFDFANSKGMNWGSLKAQLDFFANGSNEFGARNLKDRMNQAATLDEATKIFYNNYEGCTREDWLKTRIGHATDIYNKYSGSSITTNFGALDAGAAIAATSGGTGPSAHSTSSATSTGSKSSSTNSSGGLLSGILSAFTNGFGALFGGSKGSSKGGTSSSSTSGSYGSTSTGSTGGTATSGAWNFTPGNLGEGSDPVDYMQSLIDPNTGEGKISYSMSGPRNPEAGSADCSSTVRWAIKKATGGAVDIGGYTGSQQSDPNSADVINLQGATINGIPDGLKRNDILFFTRDYARKSPGTYPFGVGHVGLYMGNGKYIDHGSGMGPKIKDMPGSGLTQIRRLKDWTWDKNSTSTDDRRRYMNEKRIAELDSRVSAKGSGLLYSASNAGQKLLRDTTRSYSGEFRGIKKQTIQNAAKHLIGLSGGASEITPNNSRQMTKDTAAVLSTLITLIQQLVKNTDDIEAIYQVVKVIGDRYGTEETIAAGGSGTKSSPQQKNSFVPKAPRSNQEIELSLGRLKAACDQILAS